MSYRLTAQPDVTWDELRAFPFTGWYWCDPDGAHVEGMAPEHLPAATHVWAWGGASWGRWRIDPLGSSSGSPSVTGAILERTGDGGGNAGGDAQDDGGGVVVSILETHTWPIGGPVNLADDLRGRPITVLQVTEPVQLTFLGVQQTHPLR